MIRTQSPGSVASLPAGGLASPPAAARAPSPHAPLVGDVGRQEEGRSRGSNDSMVTEPRPRSAPPSEASPPGWPGLPAPLATSRVASRSELAGQMPPLPALHATALPVAQRWPCSSSCQTLQVEGMLYRMPLVPFASGAHSRVFLGLFRQDRWVAVRETLVPMQHEGRDGWHEVLEEVQSLFDIGSPAAPLQLARLSAPPRLLSVAPLAMATSLEVFDGWKPAVLGQPVMPEFVLLTWYFLWHAAESLQRLHTAENYGPPRGHNDVKPDNFLISWDGSLWPIDVGGQRLDAAGMVRPWVHSVNYLAPEKVDRHAPWLSNDLTCQAQAWDATQWRADLGPACHNQPPPPCSAWRRGEPLGQRAPTYPAEATDGLLPPALWGPPTDMWSLGIAALDLMLPDRQLPSGRSWQLWLTQLFVLRRDAYRAWFAASWLPERSCLHPERMPPEAPYTELYHTLYAAMDAGGCLVSLHLRVPSAPRAGGPLHRGPDVGAPAGHPQRCAAARGQRGLCPAGVLGREQHRHWRPAKAAGPDVRHPHRILV